MPIDINRLRSVLELEEKKGYDNTTVFGGLDKFLNNWVKQVLSQITVPAELRRFGTIFPNNFSYASLNPMQRQKWVESVFAFFSSPAEPVPKARVIREPATHVRPAATRTKPAPEVLSLEAPISALKGISSTLATRFARLGVKTVHDLLYFFPNRHLDYSHLKTISQLNEGSEQTVTANVWEVRVIMPGGRRSTEAILGDSTGNMRAVWFNNPWVAKNLKTGDQIVLSGRVKLFQGRPVFESPEWEALEDKELIHTGRLVPLYPLTSGLHQRQVRRLVKQTVDEFAGCLPEFLPAAILKRHTFPNLPQAVMDYHFPENFELKERARRRLAFDELFLLQLGVLSRKRRWQSEHSRRRRIMSPSLLRRESMTRSSMCWQNGQRKGVYLSLCLLFLRHRCRRFLR